MSIQSLFTKSATTLTLFTTLATAGCANLPRTFEAASDVLTQGQSREIRRLGREAARGAGQVVEGMIEECDVSTDKDRVARRDNTTGEIIYDETSQSESENCNRKKYGLPGSSNGDNNPDIFPSGSYLDIQNFTHQLGLTLQG